MRLFSFPWWTHGPVRRFLYYRVYMRVSGRRVRELERWVGELGDRIVAMERAR